MKKIKDNLAEIIGWAGFALILFTYFLLSISILKATDVLYFLLNGAGSVGIVITSFSKKNYPPMVLNILFLAVSLVAIIRLLM